MSVRLIQTGLSSLLLFLLFSVAHVYYQGIYDGAIIFKSIYFNCVSTFIFLHLIIFLLLKKRLRELIILHINKTDIAVLIFLVYFLAHSYYFKADYADRFRSFFMLIILYFGFRTIFSYYKFSTRLILAILLFTGLAQCLIGVLQLLNFTKGLNPYFKLTGSFDNPGPYAIYLASILPFSLCISLFIIPKTPVDKLNRHLSISYSIITSIILVLTDSRTAWVSALCGALVVFSCSNQFRIYWTKMVNSWPKKIFLLIAILSSSFLIYQYKKDSANGRLFIWELSKKMIVDRPIFGYGFNNFSRFYMNTQADYFSSHPEREDQIKIADKINFSFNDYIQLWMELGIVGLFLFSSVIVSLYNKNVFRIIRGSEFEQILILASASSIVTILISCCTSYPLECIPISLNLVLFISVISEQSKNNNSLYKLNIRILYLPFFLLLIFGCYFLICQLRSFRRQRENFSAEILLSKKEYEGAIKIFRSTISKSSDPYAISAYAKTLSLSKKFSESNTIVKMALEKTSDPFLFTIEGDNHKGLKDYANAEKCYTYAMFMIPNRLYPRYLLAKLYFEKGDTTKAIMAANQIINIKEKIPSMDAWYIKKDLSDMLEKSTKSH